VGFRITFGVVVLAAVTLAAGFVSHTSWLIYLSIACSGLAALRLLLSSRRRRAKSTGREKVNRKSKHDELLSWPAELAEPEGSESFSPRLPEAPPEPAVATAAALPRRRIAASVGAGASFGAGLPFEDRDTGEFAVPDMATVARDADAAEAADVAEVVDVAEGRRSQSPIRRRSFPSSAAGAPGNSAAPAEQLVTKLSAGVRPGKRNPIASEWVRSASAPPLAPPRRPAPAAAPRTPAPAPAPAPNVPARAPSGPARAQAQAPPPAPAPAPAPSAPASAPRAPQPRPAPAPPRQPVYAAPASRRGAGTPAARPPVTNVPAPFPAPAPRQPVYAPPAARRAARAPFPVEDYPFPIEAYDYLSVAEIVPLLPELDDQELVEVLLYEQAGANRVAILNRIDALLEGDED
jgi:hypothetical protein